MPKYTKSLRKNKRGRSRRGGYWFYPGPGDDEHAFTKLRNNVSSGSWKFWQKQPEEIPVSSDYQPAAEQTAPEEQAQGSLEYPQAPMEENPPMDNNEATMEPTPSMDNEQVPMEENPAPMEESNPESPENPSPTITGGRRRRQRRTTKKRKRTNMRRRTNKRRRSNKRRR